MLDHLKQFFCNDCGAVSVDWIVLAFGLICFGCLTVGTARDGTFGLADSIATSIETKKLDGLEPE